MPSKEESLNKDIRDLETENSELKKLIKQKDNEIERLKNEVLWWEENEALFPEHIRES